MIFYCTFQKNIDLLIFFMVFYSSSFSIINILY